MRSRDGKIDISDLFDRAVPATEFQSLTSIRMPTLELEWAGLFVCYVGLMLAAHGKLGIIRETPVIQPDDA